MKSGYRAYLLHILDAIKNIEEFTNLEIIGEAAKHIPASVRNKYPSIEWKRIAGMRDIY